MRLHSVVEARDEYYSLELARAARRLADEILEVRPGQTVAITADTQSDARVVWATAAAIHAAGAVPIVVTHHTQARPQMEMPKPVAAAVGAADIWIEFAVSYTVYTHGWHAALAAGVQYCGLNGLDADGMVRCIGQQDVGSLAAMADVVERLLSDADMRVASAAGSEITFSNHGIKVGEFKMKANAGKIPIMLAGQVSWSPVETSLQGRLVADGILYPPTEAGILHEPIVFDIEAGRIVRLAGGSEARLLQKWLDARNDPNLYRIAHISMGFNPGVPSPTGRILEDERAFGDIDFGFGAWVGRPAAGHFDFTCRQVSAWANGAPIMQDGAFVHPELARLLPGLG